jgi:hypothetical protein
VCTPSRIAAPIQYLDAAGAESCDQKLLDHAAGSFVSYIDFDVLAITGGHVVAQQFNVHSVASAQLSE